MSANNGKDIDLDEAFSVAGSSAVGASDVGKVAEVDVDAVKDGKDGKRKEQAVQAFKARDVEQSRAAHAKPIEKHGSDAGAYIQAIVFGGLDGCVTVFAAVAGIQGASYSAEVVLVLGFAKLLGDAISMGLAEYLSEAAELERIDQEKAREIWEYENNPEGEVQEMVELYTQKGFKEDEAATIMSLMKNHKQFFINHMLVQELGLMVPPDDEPAPWRKGLATLASFIFFGIIPLISNVALDTVHWSGFNPIFLISCIMTGVSLFILGAVKSKFAEQHWLSSGLYVVATGGTAAAVAYGVGVLLDSFISSDCG